MRRQTAILGLVLITGGMTFAQDAATPPTTQAAVLDPTDTAAVTAAEGKQVKVEGAIVKSAWSRSGKIMQAWFSKDKNSLQMVIFSKNKEDMDKAFGGDVAGALKGATVRVEGKLTVYHDKPEIIVNDPQQLTILKSATSQPAAQP